MNRSTPLERYTRLAARGGLTRHAPLRAVPSKPAVTTNVRRQLWQRCGGRCELCNLPLPEVGWHAHHVLRQSQGGPDTAANTAALHSACHRWVHDNPDRARRAGLLARAWHRTNDDDEGGPA